MNDALHHRYQIYGLNLAANRPLTMLPQMEPSAAADVTIDLRGNAGFIDRVQQLDWQRCFPPSNNKRNGFEVWRTPSLIRLCYHRSVTDVLEFIIDQAGTQVTLIRPDNIPESDAISFLLGPVLGSVLRLRRQVCVHAGVLAYNGYALALIGRKGAGKSTTAAALMQLGANLVADDVAVLSRKNNLFWVEAGYPRLRLMPDLAHVLGRSSESWPPVLSVGRKRYAPLNDKPGWRFHGKASPLAGVYVLSEWQTGAAGPIIDALDTTAALLKIIPHSYAKYMLDNQGRRREFHFLGQMVQALPCRFISRAKDVTALSQLGQLILDDFQSLLNQR